jgi:hypothetical protein
MLIIGLDVGSVRRKGGFAWATADEIVHGQDDPRALGELIAQALDEGRRVALALECPLAIPIPSPDGHAWKDLGRARKGEGDRAWSAGAGTGALATGLAQLAWLCGYLQSRCLRLPRPTTRLASFLTGDANFFIAEAMVTSTGKPEGVSALQDHADAVAAAKRLVEIIDAGVGAAGAHEVRCAPMQALNLAVIAAMHAGMDIDQHELKQDIVVAKTRPVRASSDG